MEPIDEQELIRNVGESCQTADYFSKLFLRPIEIAIGPDALGLERIIRAEGAPDKFTTQPILPAERKPTIDIESMKNQTLLSYFAGDDTRGKGEMLSTRPTVKLAICVCAYSEDSTMLQKTLTGILNNYEHFEKAGISPEEIAVVFMFDGIEKVHDSMEIFFTNMDRESRFLWKEYASTVQELKSATLFDPDDINVYSKEELAELSAELLPAKKREYMRQLQLMKELNQLKSKKGLQYSHLPEQVQKQYTNALEAEYKTQLGLDEEDKVEHRGDYYVRFFENRPQIREKCVYIAIAQTEILCQRFLSARSKTALLYSYRLETQTGKNSYVFMCVKHKNQGKLWSHNWFFNGFCRVFQPPSSILLDVGLAPAPDSLFRMYNYLTQHPKCGGVCGYMSLSIEKPESISLSDYDIFTRAGAFFFDVQRAQQFEYHFAHMLDKPFEAAFGFIHVLPGAFSGYNMSELFGKGNSILKEYFRSINEEGNYKLNSQVDDSEVGMLRRTVLPKCCHGEENQAYTTLKQQNIYLAEDRILCLGIHQQGLTMAYLPEAEALVDSITTLEKLLGQRKRWINGSYFAFEKVQDNWKCGSSQCGFSLQMAFYVFSSYLSYVSITLFFISLDLTLNTFVDQAIIPAFMDLFKVTNPEQLKDYNLLGIINAYAFPASFAVVLDFVYLILLGSMVLLSLNLSQVNQRFKKTYHLVTGLLGWYSILMYVVLVVELFKGDTFLRTDTSSPVNPVVLRILIFGIIIIHCIPPLIFVLMKLRLKYAWEVFSSSLSYLFYAPAYLHVLMIFSYCRIDDLSWGTKGLTSSAEHRLAERWATEKHIFVSRLVLTNIIFGVILKSLVSDLGSRSVVIFILTLLIGLMLVFKLIFALGYIFKHACAKSTPPPTETRVQNYRVQNKSSRLEEVYNQYRPLLASNLKEQYRKYISQIGQSSIVPKGLKSIMFTGARKSIELSKIHKDAIPKNFKRHRQLQPLKQIREVQEPTNKDKQKKKEVKFVEHSLTDKKYEGSEQDSSHELHSKKDSEAEMMQHKQQKTRIPRQSMTQPPNLSSPHQNPIQNLLGQKRDSRSDEPTSMQIIEQRPAQKYPGASPNKFKKKYAKRESEQ